VGVTETDLPFQKIDHRSWARIWGPTPVS